MAWDVDAQGNVVWTGEGAAPDISLPRFAGGLSPEEQAAILQQQTQLQAPAPERMPQLPAFAADLPRAQQEALLREQYRLQGVEYPAVSPLGPMTGGGFVDSWQTRPDSVRTTTPSGEPLDLTSILAAMEQPVSAGYTPSLVDTSAAEQMFILEQTPEEQAALDFALADLEARATAGTQAVRQGWEQVRAVNSAAAAKAAEMARSSGPEAAQLWLDAANNALTLSAQAGEALATTPGMQRVNISPTAGAERISALLAAEAPRAQALAERLGLATAEEIAAQSRTAAMMGEAYAGDIQRTLLIEANRTRQEHNERVLNRIAAERQAVAQMRFQAAQTNAQLLSQAAAQAASGATTSEGRRNAVRNLISDVREFANIDPLESEPRNGIAALMGIYGFDAETARGLILGAREGTLDWAAATEAIGG